MENGSICLTDKSVEYVRYYFDDSKYSINISVLCVCCVLCANNSQPKLISYCSNKRNGFNESFGRGQNVYSFVNWNHFWMHSQRGPSKCCCHYYYIRALSLSLSLCVSLPINRSVRVCSLSSLSLSVYLTHTVHYWCVLLLCLQNVKTITICLKTKYAAAMCVYALCCQLHWAKNQFASFSIVWQIFVFRKMCHMCVYIFWLCYAAVAVPNLPIVYLARIRLIFPMAYLLIYATYVMCK